MTRPEPGPARSGHDAVAATGDWLRFCIACHAAPDSPRLASPCELQGMILQPLAMEPAELAQPLPISFESACEALARLPRMFCEPDGSFVWRGDQPRPWQVDGVLYDDGRRLVHVELKGECPAEAFQRLLATITPDPRQLVYQLLREGLVLDQPQFHRWASRPAN
ncbi:MAG: hypothetical protein J5I93_22265 [Pirellulaceae bacterium]|nr:hypothetical protein [Pirellulaceae bacterium]